MKTTEDKQNFMILRAKGNSFDTIARQTGIAKQTLIDWSRELEAEISNLKAQEMEALYEQYYLHKEARIKRYGTILNKIAEELEERDFTKVNTGRLLEIYLAYYEKATQELPQPVFTTTADQQEERQAQQLLELLAEPVPGLMK
jgi:lysozyme family protein